MNKREENRKRGEEIRRKRLKEQQERLKRFAVAKSSAALPTSAKPNSVNANTASSRKSSLPVQSADDRKPLSLQNKGVDPRAHGSHVLHGGVNRQNQSPSSNRALRHNDNQESREKNVERKYAESGCGSIGGKGDGRSSPAIAWGGNFRSQWKAWGKRSVSPKEERKNLDDSSKCAPDDSTSIKPMPKKLDEKNLDSGNKNSDQTFTREAKVHSTNERETQGFRKREHFQKPEGLNDTRPGKRSRRSETDNTPGRGMGRGRGTTLPAWMTRKNSGESLQTNYPRPNADVVDSLNDIRPGKRSRTLEIGSTPGRSMGRGRGTTLPAWMTRRNTGEMTEESL